MQQNMKRLLLTAAVLGLVGTAWAGALKNNIPPVKDKYLAEAMKRDPNLADAIRQAQKDGAYKENSFDIPQNELDRISSAENQRNELHLRQMGVSPSTAKKAIWGASHFISSSCAFYVHELLGEYGLAEHGHYDQDDIEGLVIKIENSGVCEKKNLR